MRTPRDDVMTWKRFLHYCTFARDITFPLRGESIVTYGFPPKESAIRCFWCFLCLNKLLNELLRCQCSGPSRSWCDFEIMNVLTNCASLVSKPTQYLEEVLLKEFEIALLEPSTDRQTTVNNTRNLENVLKRKQQTGFFSGTCYSGGNLCTTILVPHISVTQMSHMICNNS